MASDFQGGLQLAIAAAALLVTSGKEKPLPPQAFGPELEPVVDLALPLLEVFNQHLPSPLYAVGLYVQWVQASFLKQRRAHVSWLTPVLLLRLFPEYFTFLSITQPGREWNKRVGSPDNPDPSLARVAISNSTEVDSPVCVFPVTLRSGHAPYFG